ncbi:homeodomain-like, Zinc finger, RING/FYVE/PHD-type, Myb-like domain protein [Artemisia annua]|uniref:Homeodomain-like, Zinc finger, RING/FYVE/PHD-type, Myb-like domain protein n=1 Tax=Artemisia annua TaxID=35608 RepID=A0A2U1PB94_ARTAN|nr:homeodomain-like, Zinc finger, RING/FYVE/PHD-type, Myb-like domain protein [Artemisia annua]
MDWTENQQCLLCDEGGNLLVCSGDSCPISIHQSCMGCEAHLDDAGNFYCPYCLYKQITTEARQLKEKVMLTKKALSTFLEEETTDGKEDEISSKDKSADDINSVGDDVQNHCEEASDTLVPEQSNVNSCRVMVVYIKDKMKADQLESDVSKRIKVDNRRGNAKCKIKVVNQQQHSTSLTLPSRNGKHKVFWTEEEEDKLKEGVKKFSSATRKNLPWKKILDFGRHVFDPYRTPSDLKDKWRKIAK